MYSITKEVCSKVTKEVCTITKESGLKSVYNKRRSVYTITKEECFNERSVL